MPLGFLEKVFIFLYKMLRVQKKDEKEKLCCIKNSIFNVFILLQISV